MFASSATAVIHEGVIEDAAPRMQRICCRLLVGGSLFAAGALAALGAGFEPTIVAQAAPLLGVPPAGMAWIPGGEFSMGCADPTGLPGGGREPMNDARPIHRVHVDGFWMDRTVVTNDEFARFVQATGYVTQAEQKPRAEDLPGVPAAALVPGSVVFTLPPPGTSSEDWHQWWRYVPGADWRHPTGPETNLQGRGSYPVADVTYADAQAYAQWAGKRLPTEAEWEFAARGGLAGQLYPWGNELRPAGKWMANTWQGHFPDENSGADGFIGLAPVASFVPNGYGLYDMAGNVWQWCADWYRSDYYASLAAAAAGGVARNPPGPADSFDPDEPGVAKRVQRGGSFLCTDQYCTRYMLGTRGKGDPLTSSSHVGFRCVRGR